MDKRRMRNEDKLELCKNYFYGGFALLPFLWGVNAVWFFNDAFLKPRFPQQHRIKSYVIWSMVGAVVWVAIFTTWVTIYQLYRVEWGETGEKLSFVIPKGIP